MNSVHRCNVAINTQYLTMEDEWVHGNNKTNINSQIMIAVTYLWKKKRIVKKKIAIPFYSSPKLDIINELIVPLLG